MADRNGFIEALDTALQHAETPVWMKPVLLKLRDDHGDLREHLDWHRRWRGVLGKVGTTALGAAGVGLLWWILSGGARALVP